METLRNFSAFFVHDLKNLASKLSMMLQNFPDNYDNPDFRKDALALIAQSVDKINQCRGCDVDKPRNLAKSVTVE